MSSAIVGDSITTVVFYNKVCSFIVAVASCYSARTPFPYNINP